MSKKRVLWRARARLRQELRKRMRNYRGRDHHGLGYWSWLVRKRAVLKALGSV